MTSQEFEDRLATAKELLDGLSCNAIDSQPITMDWAETMGEDMEGWVAYEALECDTCGREVVVSSLGEEEHRYIEDEFELDEMPEEGETFKCFDCEHEFTVKYVEDDYEFNSFVCPECDTGFWEGETYHNNCPGSIYFEGPMMNYFYPVDNIDCESAARAISHLPLCVVELKDGTTGLALTGGGMDLSLEIVRAFVALGYYPPAHFARLSRMAGWEKDPVWLEALVCCQGSLEIAASWATGKLVEVSDMIDTMREAASEEAA